MPVFPSFSLYQKTTLYIFGSLAFVTSLASFLKWKKRKNEDLMKQEINGEDELLSLINEWRILQIQGEKKRKKPEKN